MVSDTGPRHDAAGAVSDRADIHVLLVDDDEDWLELLTETLRRQRDSFTVETATDLSTAAAALTEDVDCIVCDYNLEEGTGLDLLAEVRAEDDRPFILVTGHGDESVASDAIGQQVTDYIPKRSLGARTGLLVRRIEKAVDAHRTQRALARERRGKDAMLDIVTAASSREEIMREFCDHLVNERDYECAWIGTPGQSDGIFPRAVAGEDAYLDAAIALETMPEPETEPAFVAVRRGETHVVTHIGADAPETGWRAAAAEFGFESAAATPITHDEMRFGVLAVYKPSPRFTPDEAALLEEYGRLIGYTLRSAGWKESLLSATPVAIEFELKDERVPLLAVDRQLPAGSRLHVLTTVPREDTLLYVLEVTGASATDMRDLPIHVDAVVESTVTRCGEPLRCELVVSQPTPESVLAAHGAEFADTTIERERASVTIRRRSEQDHQSLVDALQAVYPEARLRTVRPADAVTGRMTATGFLQSLTDKQRRALELAYFYGYFERPRRHNTTEVAEKLDLSRQTFTQHLRAAERKLLSHLFGESGDHHPG